MNSSKRLIKIAVTSAIAATLSITAASALYAGETTATNLNLRATPGGAASGSLPYGTKLAVISIRLRSTARPHTSAVHTSAGSRTPSLRLAQASSSAAQPSISVPFQIPNAKCLAPSQTAQRLN